MTEKSSGRETPSPPPEQSIFAIINAEPGKGLMVDDSGTGFVIAVTEAAAYALTATHIFSEAPGSVIEQRLRHLAPEGPRIGARRIWPNQQCRAMFISDRGVNNLRVSSMYGSIGSDVAVLKLEPDSQGGSLEAIRPLSLSLVPEIAANLVLLAVDFDKKSFSSTIVQRENSSAMLNRVRFRLGSRQGTLVEPPTDVYSGRKALAPGYVFRSTIAIPPGMSGGPVFECAPSGYVYPPVVCGVASSDNDDPECPSTCSAIPNAFPLTIDGNETVLDWLQSGKITSRGIDPKRIALLYDDAGSSVTIALKRQ